VNQVLKIETNVITFSKLMIVCKRRSTIW